MYGGGGGVLICIRLKHRAWSIGTEVSLSYRLVGHLNAEVQKLFVRDRKGQGLGEIACTCKLYCMVDNHVFKTGWIGGCHILIKFCRSFKFLGVSHHVSARVRDKCWDECETQGSPQLHPSQ